MYFVPSFTRAPVGNRSPCATVVDAVSQGANYTGLLLAGSGTYIVIYSSVTLWVAVLSRAVLWHAQDRVIRHGNHTIVF